MGNESAPAEMYCPACGYDLRAIQSNRCPECGQEIDPTKLGQTTLPWLHRDEIGKIRAFYRTAYLASFRPARLAGEMNCPAHFADAVKFRRLAVLHALLVVAGILTGLLWTLLLFDRSWVWLPNDKLGSILEWGFVLAMWLCIAMFLFAASGVASYFFHPKSLDVVRQNRAVALSYYGSAPLVFVPLTIGLACGFGITAGVLMDQKDAGVLPGIFLLPLAIPIGWQLWAMWKVPITLLRVATRCEIGRRIGLGIFLPFAWMVLATLLLYAVPAACVAVALMILNFRQ